MERKMIGIEDKVPLSLLVPLSLQHLFAMFGASILVPIVFGIQPGIVLLMNGVGTLIFILLTKGKSPAYLGSSFAFLAPASLVVAAYGYEYALGGFVVIGLCGCLLSALIYKFGTKWINVVLPPAAMGPVVALIGLELAGHTVGGGAIGANLMSETTTYQDVVVFGVTLGTAIFGSILFRKFLAVIPILIALVVGYLTALAFGMIDFTPVLQSSFFVLPQFTFPKFDATAILTILPVLFVIVNEHIGHQIVTSKIVGKDLIKDPGLHRTLLGDNVSTTISAFLGSVPTTTYGENIGVMAVTKVYSVRVIAGAAIVSIAMAFIGPLSAFIATIPGNVIGGMTFLLYGMIGASGIRILVDSKVDYSKNVNLILTSVVFVTGLSGVTVTIGDVEFRGMVLAGLVAMILSSIIFVLQKFKLTNDSNV